MGGLYFWVCKMKPETPMLGCESETSLITSVLPMTENTGSLRRFADQYCPSFGGLRSSQTGWIYSIAMTFTGTSGNLR